MEYLVTMTTRVPHGTPTQDVVDIRAREAAHTRDLAAQGRVLRLWRPPLGPGEWRTIGLFSADDPDDLEGTLASMPLRVWRTDEVTALGPHANDPGRDTVPLAAGGEEYLVTFTVDIPDTASPDTVEEMIAREAARAGELADEGPLIRLWALPGRGRNLGLWQAAGAGQLGEILRSLPLAAWLTVETVPLTPHPSDPASGRRATATKPSA
ncbi:muconolactone Delta-isomerase family protein [Streptomyces sp. NPDC047043]|uniref:muconolactone Delta-isomerase family protein n=1 Tax=Streptomyces sp. NPDC047043 TaxID=3154497 RepID=UPI0033E9AAD8